MEKRKAEPPGQYVDGGGVEGSEGECVMFAQGVIHTLKHSPNSYDILIVYMFVQGEPLKVNYCTNGT